MRFQWRRHVLLRAHLCLTLVLTAALADVCLDSVAARRDFVVLRVGKTFWGCVQIYGFFVVDLTRRALLDETIIHDALLRMHIRTRTHTYTRRSSRIHLLVVHCYCGD